MSDVPSIDRNAPATSLEVRNRLVEALNLDPIGPRAGHALASERLPGWVRPSNWYLTGFLIPASAAPEHRGDADEDDDLDEPRSKSRANRPSSPDLTCAAHKRWIGTNRSPTSTTRTRPSSPPVTGYRRTGTSSTVFAGGCARPGFRAPQWRRPRRWTSPGSSSRWRPSGALADGAAAATAPQPLVDEYRRWIDERRAATGALEGERRTTGEGLLHRAGHAADRIEQGIALLASDEDALDAFRVANRAVASALRQRLGDQFDDRRPPRWRAFQLAFILLKKPASSGRCARHVAR